MATTSRYEPGIVSTSIDSSGEVGNATSSLSMGSRLPASLSTVGKGDSKLQAQLLEESYVRSGEITKIFSKTFYFGSRRVRARASRARPSARPSARETARPLSHSLAGETSLSHCGSLSPRAVSRVAGPRVPRSLMSDAQRKAVWAIYVWCRRTDDIVDSPVAMLQGTARLTQEIEEWEGRLERIWEGIPTDTLDLALADTVVQYPDLPIAPFKDMVLGMLMDTPGHPLAKDRYETWDDLYEYCYRVAGTVGLMTLPIMGTAPGFTQDDAKKPAEALGIAFQITNILRDVGEDAVRGRIYLPREDMDRFGVTEKQIFDGRIDDNYRELVKFEIARAREYYSQALSGIPMLAPSARLPVRSSLDMYSKILRRIEENEYDNFKKASARARGARVAPFSPSSLTDFVLSRSARTSPSWRNFWICRSRGG